jgi:hypothetical protein
LRFTLLLRKQHVPELLRIIRRRRQLGVLSAHSFANAWITQDV